jgi:phosphodiesterase/alkaline phosphatase D-like protein
MAIRARTLSRRTFLVRGCASAASLAAGLAAPGISRAADRPLITHGVQSGDVSGDGAIVWSRADRPARMMVELASSDGFRDIHQTLFADALPEGDFAAKLLVDDLPPGQDIFYRVRFQDLSCPDAVSEPHIGHFRTPAAGRSPVSFTWSGDVAGQGWGIDEARGGMRGFAAMARNAPDFFIHCGDGIYADCPMVPLLDVFLIDMRSYRGANDMHHSGGVSAPTELLGRTQLAWLKRELSRSKAVWKVIAAGLPLGLVSQDAVAQGDGPPHGREHEVAELLSFMQRAGVRNVVWLTADMHYTAAHYYDPNRAVFQDFDPFHEFVSGPLHAGTWGPAPLDNTFGPQVLFQKGCTPEQGENLAPCYGLQFFGRVDIDGQSGVMTVSLKDIDNRTLWSLPIAPSTPARAAVERAI